VSRRGKRTIVAGVLLLLALPVVLRLVSLNPLRAPIATALSDAIGREVRILGDLRLDLPFTPHLEARHLTLANPPGWPSPCMAEIGVLRLDVDFWRLLSGTLEIDELRFSDVHVRLETSADGRHNWEPMGRGREHAEGEHDIRVGVDAVRLKDVALTYRDEQAGRTWEASLDRVALASVAGGEGLRAQLKGTFHDGPLDVALRMDPPPGNDGDGLRALLVRGRVMGGYVEGAGTIASPAELSGIDMALSAGFADLRVLSAVVGRDLSPLRSLSGTGLLSDSRGPLALSDVRVNVGVGPAGWASLSGAVSDVVRLRGIDATVRVEGPHLSAMTAFVRHEQAGFPPLLGLSGLTERRRDAHRWHPDRSGADERAVEVRLEGDLENALAGTAIDVSVRLTATSLAVLGDVARQPLPPIGPVVGVGRVTHADGTIGIEDVHITIGERRGTWAELQGRIGDVQAFEGVEFGGDLLALDLDWLEPIVGADLPPIAPVRGSVLVSDADGTLGLERIRLERLPDPVQIEVVGRVDDLASFGEVDLAVTLRARDAAAAGGTLGVPMPVRGPVALRGRVVGSRARLTAADVAVTVKDTTLRVDLAAVIAPGTRPRFDMSVATPVLHLADFGIEPAAEQRLLSGDAPEIRLALLRAFDATVTLEATQIRGHGGLVLQDASARMTLANGDLQVPEIKLLFPDGYLAAGARIDASRPSPSMWLAVKGTGIDLEKVVAQFSEAPLASGTLAVDADLRSEASSARELLTTLRGGLQLVIEGSRTTSRYSSSFAASVTKALFDKEWKKRDEPVRCIMGDFEIDRGVAQGKTLLLDSEEITITGTGTADLGAGTVDVTLTPSVGGPELLTKSVELKMTGPLAEPEYVPVKRSPVAGIVRYILGAGPIKKLLPKSTKGLPREGPCAEALSRAG
jgi:uncharacterized protein involved in outer membrane biogenesis